MIYDECSPPDADRESPLVEVPNGVVWQIALCELPCEERGRDSLRLWHDQSETHQGVLGARAYGRALPDHANATRPRVRAYEWARLPQRQTSC